MSIRNSLDEIFKSKRDRWATVFVWGITLFMWLTGLAIILMEESYEVRLLAAPATILSSLLAPWFWLTTRYRISETSLLLQSGPFRKKLELRDIRRVVRTRAGQGWSFAFSQDCLQIDVEGSARGFRVSPEDRFGFVAALARRCDHLVIRGEGLASTFSTEEPGEFRAPPAEHGFLKLILPAGAFNAVRAGTKKWLIECKCGHKRDLWDAGGVRHKGFGEPRQLLKCSKCGRATWHRTRRKTEAESKII